MKATLTIHSTFRLVALFLCLWLPACHGGDALVEMSAANALESLSAQTRRALDEYRADLAASDDAREAAVIGAFIARTRRDVQDDARLDANARDFAAAMMRMRTDRQTAWQRHAAATDNIEQVDEVAQGLRRLATQSLSLGDEWNRYVGKFIEARRKMNESQAHSPAATGTPAPSPAPVAAVLLDTLTGRLAPPQAAGAGDGPARAKPAAVSAAKK